LAGWAALALLLFLAAGGAARGADGAWLGAPRGAAAVLCVATVAALVAVAGLDAGRVAAGVAFVPAALLLALPWPGVRALSGAPLFALAAAAALLLVSRSDVRPPAWCFFPLVLALYAAVAHRAQVQVGPEGDEPHYLMVADSLLRDGDLSLERDYAEGRYAAFHPRPLAPHYRVRGRQGEIYSLHALGLSLVVLPAYALGGAPGASFFMALLAALLARELRLLFRDWLGARACAEGAAWLVALSPPLIHYAGLVFTEVPAALLAAVVLRRGRRVSGARTALLCAAAVAFLPWLHVRYVALAVVLAAYLSLARPRRAVVAALLGAGAASALALMLHHRALYGFLDPRGVWGRRPELSLALLPEGLQGLLLDQEFGLLVYAPILALFVPGVFLLWRRSRRVALAVGMLVAVALLTAGAWPMWRGGFNPPGRFLVPALPALALGVAAVLGRGLSAPVALLAGWSLWTGLAGAAEPRLVHRDRDGTAPFFRAHSGGEEWTRLLPGFVLEESARDRGGLALVWGLALAAGAAAWRGRGTGWGLGASAAGLMAAAAAASALADARTGGRDAVRVIGRPALAVPGWSVQAQAVAAWGPEALAWGPLFEPHRHPDGADLGSRLPLRPGAYHLRLEGQAVPGAAPPAVVVLAERGAEPPLPPQPVPLAGAAGTPEGTFVVAPGGHVAAPGRAAAGAPRAPRGSTLARGVRS
jgi:hypothetical protein